ncbi:hypothetical protein H310_05807 [Aphanomyces invadans]|uniref:Micro-fibrillar-associated protein 1 C-terminal domain-containing protein n=1 Tax=Aphanomyces invadans TaxID=157072 RepID=A0A024U753_9STRA|nr:hypothetical protein H310_05807 [Aphanomyces invadans]ETW02256.1 hypothetical protein H310_05807 [Aphanomyces invadans]|eukprot:XP_008868861.1 hypothetical protein H310_05807 [Aphanomyces invadans]
MSLFTKKDLGLLLPDTEPGDAMSLRHTRRLEETDEYEAPQPKVDSTKKVMRYRAGQVPDFAAVGEHMPDDGSRFLTGSKKAASSTTPASGQGQTPKQRRKVVAQVVKAVSVVGAPAPAAPTLAARLVESESEESDEEDDRRARLKNKLLAQKRDEPDLLLSESTEALALESESKPVARAVASSQLVSSESESSEWETDTDSSDGEQILKPIFVPKEARDTIREQEEKLRALEERDKALAARAVEKKAESRKLVAEVLQREESDAVQRMQEEATDSEMPDDTDGLNPEQEQKEWELRELRRLKRDRDAREEREREAAETLRRRNMTDEEREKEDAALGKRTEKEKKKWKFMQKYYHKGAFYVDDKSVTSENDVRRREADEPTLEDKTNRENLPAVMQVKNFGKSGRTKYTHLTDQDTTDHITPLKNDELRAQYASKLSGLKPINPAPFKRQRR